MGSWQPVDAECDKAMISMPEMMVCMRRGLHVLTWGPKTEQGDVCQYAKQVIVAWVDLIRAPAQFVGPAGVYRICRSKIVVAVIVAVTDIGATQNARVATVRDSEWQAEWGDGPIRPHQGVVGSAVVMSDDCRAVDG